MLYGGIGRQAFKSESSYKGEEMSSEVTELVFILDRSGSMGSMTKEAIGGFNAFLEEQKKLPGEAKLTLVLFDHEYSVICSGKNIKEVEPLTEETYVPRGTTALLDAVGRTLDDVGKRVNSVSHDCAACGAGKKSTKVMVAILTDGLENASKDYKKTRINEMIAHHKKDHDWHCMFLAANQDAFSEGSSLGVLHNMSMNYTMDSAGFTKSFMTANASAKLYRSLDADDYNQVIASNNISDFTDDQGNETKLVSDLINKSVDVKDAK